MKKKIIYLCMVVALGATAVIGGTLAYFTDTDTETNIFTVGDVNIELAEDKWVAEEKDNVYPGEPLAKDPVITNTGANPCFVRVQVTGLDCLEKAGLSSQNIGYRTDYVDGKLGENWVNGGDGYFYYTKVLTYTGDTYNTDLVTVTDALFDQIVIPTDVTNAIGDLDIDYNIVVTAQAVQAQGARTSWSAVKAMTVPEIAGWFAACGF